MFRFGEKNNLSFAVPWHGHYINGKININIQFLQSTGNVYQGASWNDLVGMEYENVSYNIFCNHGKFDYPQMSKVMGSRERTKYITMIRDPVELFISAWYYSIHKGYEMTLGMKNSTEQ